jgi:hypothetical protein
LVVEVQVVACLAKLLMKVKVMVNVNVELQVKVKTRVVAVLVNVEGVTEADAEEGVEQMEVAVELILRIIKQHNLFYSIVFIFIFSTHMFIVYTQFS